MTNPAVAVDGHDAAPPHLRETARELHRANASWQFQLYTPRLGTLAQEFVVDEARVDPVDNALVSVQTRMAQASRLRAAAE